MSDQQLFATPFSKTYWRCAFNELKNTRMLVFAALIIALRVAFKLFAIPIGPSLNITTGFFVNALGSMCYGPVVALISGAISDTIGCILFPQGIYFFPFIFVEMTGGFLFAIFLYRAKLSSIRVILSRFSVVFVCNLILNPILLYFYGKYTNEAYTILSIPRLVKNIALFPAEALLLILFLNVSAPVSDRMGLTNIGIKKLEIKKQDIVLLSALTLVAAAGIVLYCFVYLPNK